MTMKANEFGKGKTAEEVAADVAQLPSMANKVRELFAEYDLKDEGVECAKSSLDIATKERSAVVEAIAAAIAPKKKITRNGKELTIVVRGQTFFFRGAKSHDTFEV